MSTAILRNSTFLKFDCMKNSINMGAKRQGVDSAAVKGVNFQPISFSGRIEADARAAQ